MVHPASCKELRRRISAAIYGWDRPLTFTNPRDLIVAQTTSLRFPRAERVRQLQRPGPAASEALRRRTQQRQVPAQAEALEGPRAETSTSCRLFGKNPRFIPCPFFFFF